jgi:hypothetical protein
MIPFIANSTNFVKKKNTERRGFIPHEDFCRPATHPIHFAAYFTRQNHRCAAWAIFFFYGKRTLKIS